MSLLPELKKRFPPIIVLLALLSAFPPLATDMYLPALPLLQQEWHAPLVAINLTLVAFFMSYCACLLLYGPLSDRYGRRPPLFRMVKCCSCTTRTSRAGIPTTGWWHRPT